MRWVDGAGDCDPAVSSSMEDSRLVSMRCRGAAGSRILLVVSEYVIHDLKITHVDTLSVLEPELASRWSEHLVSAQPNRRRQLNATLLSRVHHHCDHIRNISDRRKVIGWNMSSECLNVVVVGAASAGINVATKLAKSLPATHRVVLVEANPVAYWSIGALRAAVQPGFESKIVHDLTSQSVFGSDDRHVVLAGTRVVDLQADHVVVDKDVSAVLSGSSTDGGRTRIAVDRVVLAIGSDYGFPARISPSARTKQDVLDQFIRMQNDIAAASSILIVGGGPTGVEFAGELLQVHPGKKVTLITRGPGLVTNGNDNYAGLSSKLLSQLKTKGVKVILNDSIALDQEQTGPLESMRTFQTEKAEQVSADYIMIGSGGKPHTRWITDIDAEILDANGRIQTSAHFSVLGSHRWAKYYAIGDAAATPGPKVAYLAAQHAPLLAHNMVCDITRQTDSLKQVSAPSADIIAVPLGTTGGAAYFIFFSLGAWLTSLIKGKTLFLATFEAWFKA